MKKIILDCDPGMDDSMAIVMAVKSPELDVLGITTVNGNYPVDVTQKNARKVLELLGKTEIPVARGMANPIIRNSPGDPSRMERTGRRKQIFRSQRWHCLSWTQWILLSER